MWNSCVNIFPQVPSSIMPIFWLYSNDVLLKTFIFSTADRKTSECNIFAEMPFILPIFYNRSIDVFFLLEPCVFFFAAVKIPCLAL